MQTKKQRIIPAREASHLKAATFRSFDRRPANYYRDMITDEDQAAVQRINEQEFNTRVEQLLAAERQRLSEAQRHESQKQYEAGLKQGRSEAGAEFKRGLELLTEYARVVQAEKLEMAAQAEKNSIELAFLLAEKILGHEVETKPEAVADIARMALEQVLDCSQIELKVNPEDFGYLKTVQKDLEALLSSQAKLELRADKALDRGSCVIETERGVLDARIVSQLATLRTKMNPNAAARA
ncbi:MAG TPA: FliH/SctL family protein [bacterium]|jgi:flagellar assembly protein FliH